jgi:hypothetical protein
MEDWSPEAKALYSILKAETKEEYEARFLDYKKESLDVVRIFVEDTKAKLLLVNESIDVAKVATGAKIAEICTSLGAELATMEGKLSAEITQLSTTVDRALRLSLSTEVDGSPASQNWHPGGSTVGPSGHREDHLNRGLACVSYTPPPGRRMQPDTSTAMILNPLHNSSVPDSNFWALVLNYPCSMATTLNCGSTAVRSISSIGPHLQNIGFHMVLRSSSAQRRRGWSLT